MNITSFKVLMPAHASRMEIQLFGNEHQKQQLKVIYLISIYILNITMHIIWINKFYQIFFNAIIFTYLNVSVIHCNDSFHKI
jgi:hypothetical protein